MMLRREHRAAEHSSNSADASTTRIISDCPSQKKIGVIFLKQLKPRAGYGFETRETTRGHQGELGAGGLGAGELGAGRLRTMAWARSGGLGAGGSGKRTRD